MKTINFKTARFLIQGIMIIAWINQAWTQNNKPGIINSDKIRSIALITTTIARPVAENNFAYEIVEDRAFPIMEAIVQLEKSKLDWIRTTTAKQLSNSFTAKVIWGDTLNSLPGIRSLKPKYKKVILIPIDESRYFPAFVVDTGDLIPFLSYRNDAKGFFKNPDNYKNKIGEIGQAISTDLIAICNIYCSIKVMVTSRLCITTELYLFYPDGTLFVSGRGTVESVPNTTVDNLFDYETAFGSFPSSLYLALSEVTQNVSKKMNKK